MFALTTIHRYKWNEKKLFTRVTQDNLCFLIYAHNSAFFYSLLTYLQNNSLVRGKKSAVSDRAWRQQQMRVLFVLSSRRAFRWRRDASSVWIMPVHWLRSAGCPSSRSGLRVFSNTRIRPSYMFAFLVVSLPGERRQRRPGSKTWRLPVLAEREWAVGR